MNVEVSTDNHGASIRRKLLKNRGQLIKESCRKRLTARTINADEQKVATSRRNIAAEILKCTDTDVKGPLLNPHTVK